MAVVYLGTRESPPLRVVGSSSKMEEMSLPSGTETSVYMTFSLGVRRRARRASCSESSCDTGNNVTMETKHRRSVHGILFTQKASTKQSSTHNIQILFLTLTYSLIMGSKTANSKIRINVLIASNIKACSIYGFCKRINYGLKIWPLQGMMKDL